MGVFSLGYEDLTDALTHGILINFEMTHQFALIPLLMLAGLISQMIARSMNHANFYKEVLLNDGHRLEHIIPPRDLRGWQNLPVSAIAQFEPVVIVDQSTSALEELLRHHPYRLFPVVEEGTLKGTVARSEMESSISQHRPLKLDPAITCRPGDIIREIQSRFIESASGFIVLVEGSDATVLGVVTLHDVLRAQVDLSEREGA